MQEVAALRDIIEHNDHLLIVVQCSLRDPVGPFRPRVLSTENVNKVLERMGVTENATLTVRREEGGKIRVTSNLWDVAKVLGKNEVLEVRNVDGRLYLARMPRFHNDWAADRAL